MRCVLSSRWSRDMTHGLKICLPVCFVRLRLAPVGNNIVQTPWTLSHFLPPPCPQPQTSLGIISISCDIGSKKWVYNSNICILLPLTLMAPERAAEPLRVQRMTGRAKCNPVRDAAEDWRRGQRFLVGEPHWTCRQSDNFMKISCFAKRKKKDGWKS